MAEGDFLLQADGLCKFYSVRQSRFGVKLRAKAVDGVNLKLRRGRNLAIVGESGCGKTTIGRMLCGIAEVSQGKVLIEGKELTSLKRRELARLVQPIFQDPYSALNPMKTIQQILEKPFKIHNIPHDQREIERLLEDVGLSPASKYMHRFPHELSGGQRQRVLIARALALRPKLVIADEPFSGLDATIQAQTIRLMKDLQSRYGLTYIFITHDMYVVREICAEVIVIYLGKVVEYGPVDTVLLNPRHPYTISLLKSYPSGDPASREWVESPPASGDVPSIISIPSGCRFHPRCPFAIESCRKVEPSLDEYDGGHFVACPVINSGISGRRGE
ncbi:MAG: ABC transporter ATP-binding protein [Conexivisphaerales archaeon]